MQALVDAFGRFVSTKDPQEEPVNSTIPTYEGDPNQVQTAHNTALNALNEIGMQFTDIPQVRIIEEEIKSEYDSFIDLVQTKVNEAAQIKTRFIILSRMSPLLQKRSQIYVTDEMAKSRTQLEELNKWKDEKEKSFADLFAKQITEYKFYTRIKFSLDQIEDFKKLGTLEQNQAAEERFSENEKKFDKQQAKIQAVWEGFKFRLIEANKEASKNVSSGGYFSSYFSKSSTDLVTLPTNLKDEFVEHAVCLLNAGIIPFREKIRVAEQALTYLKQPVHKEGFKEELEKFTNHFKNLSESLIEAAKKEEPKVEKLQKQFKEHNFEPSEESKQLEYKTQRISSDIQKAELSATMVVIKKG